VSLAVGLDDKIEVILKLYLSPLPQVAQAPLQKLPLGFLLRKS
jgi:hypothetical protein